MTFQEQLTKFALSAITFIGKSQETFQNTINQLAENQRISVEEGQKIYDDFLKNTESKRDELELQLGKILERLAQNLHLATASQIEHLQKQIDELKGEKVANLENKTQ